MRKTVWALFVTAFLIGTALAGCEGKLKKLGEGCGDDGDCATGTCWERQCVRLGIECVPSTAASDFLCEDDDPCTQERCGEMSRCLYTALAECEPSGSGVCFCDGATLEPDAGCNDWTDRNECTAWHSVVTANGGNAEASYPDGTEYCLQACCITLRCN